MYTPTNNSEVSEKLNSFWTGPWRVVCRLAPTTYKLEPVLDQLETRPSKLPTVQVDRMKKYYPKDHPVTPPVNFDPDFMPNDPFKEHFPFKPKNHVAKAMATGEIIEKDELDDVKVIPPWKSHINPDIPRPDPDFLDPNPKKAKRIKLSKKPVNLKRCTGLPAPMTTRSKVKQAETSILAMLTRSRTNFDLATQQKRICSSTINSSYKGT